MYPEYKGKGVRETEDLEGVDQEHYHGHTFILLLLLLLLLLTS